MGWPWNEDEHGSTRTHGGWTRRGDGAWEAMSILGTLTAEKSRSKRREKQWRVTAKSEVNTARLPSGVLGYASSLREAWDLIAMPWFAHQYKGDPIKARDKQRAEGRAATRQRQAAARRRDVRAHKAQAAGERRARKAARKRGLSLEDRVIVRQVSYGGGAGPGSTPGDTYVDTIRGFFEQANGQPAVTLTKVSWVPLDQIVGRSR